MEFRSRLLLMLPNGRSQLSSRGDGCPRPWDGPLRMARARACGLPTLHTEASCQLTRWLKPKSSLTPNCWDGCFLLIKAFGCDAEDTASSKSFPCTRSRVDAQAACDSEGDTELAAGKGRGLGWRVDYFLMCETFTRRIDRTGKLRRTHLSVGS